MIFYGRQDIDEADVQAVGDVIRSDFLTQGPWVERFEKRVADYCGAKHAVAVTNATSALHIACLAAGLGEGDILWTSPITFVASANCGRYCGADVEFVDINPRTYNMDVGILEKQLEMAKRKGSVPKVVVPVHIAGQSCNMKQIYDLKKKYGFMIVEDASHALGADYLGGKVGSCAFSDMTVFSFHPVKIITTGEGGIVLTNNDELFEKLRLYRSHGITRDSLQMTHKNEGSWYYQQVMLGFNYRMTDIQAALGCSQMDRLEVFVARRRELASRYDELLKGLPLVTPLVRPDTIPSWHIYIVRLDLKKIKKSKQKIFEEMRENGIVLNVHYIPVHTQPYYENIGHRPEECPEALCYYAEAMTLPLYYGLTDGQQDKIVDSLWKILR